jgi:hypothetical protein
MPVMREPTLAVRTRDEETPANPALVMRPLATTRPTAIAELAPIRELRLPVAEVPMLTVVEQLRVAGRQAIVERKLPAAALRRPAVVHPPTAARRPIAEQLPPVVVVLRLAAVHPRATEQPRIAERLPPAVVVPRPAAVRPRTTEQLPPTMVERPRIAARPRTTEHLPPIAVDRRPVMAAQWRAAVDHPLATPVAAATPPAAKAKVVNSTNPARDSWLAFSTNPAPFQQRC